MKANLPKLKITKWNGEEEVQEIEKWEEFPFGIDDLIVVEGQEVYSYAELLELAGKEPYKSQKYISLRILPLIAGG